MSLVGWLVVGISSNTLGIDVICLVSRSHRRKVSKTILVSMGDEFIQLLYLVDTPRQVYPAYRLPSYDLRYPLLADVFSYCALSAVFVALK